MTRRRFARPCSFSSRKTARRYGFQGLLNLHSLALRFQGFAADANGNLSGDGVWTYTYNTDNQLTAANKTGSANSQAYDGAGRLRQTTLAGIVTNLSYDGSDLVAEYNSTGTLLRRYVHGPGVDQPLVWYEGAVTTNKTWLYSDHQGDAIMCADRMMTPGGTSVE